MSARVRRREGDGGVSASQRRRVEYRVTGRFGSADAWERSDYLDGSRSCVASSEADAAGLSKERFVNHLAVHPCDSRSRCRLNYSVCPGDLFRRGVECLANNGGLVRMDASLTCET